MWVYLSGLTFYRQCLHNLSFPARSPPLASHALLTNEPRGNDAFPNNSRHLQSCQAESSPPTGSPSEELFVVSLGIMRSGVGRKSRGEDTVQGRSKLANCPLSTHYTHLFSWGCFLCKLCICFYCGTANCSEMMFLRVCSPIQIAQEANHSWSWVPYCSVPSDMLLSDPISTRTNDNVVHFSVLMGSSFSVASPAFPSSCC